MLLCVPHFVYLAAGGGIHGLRRAAVKLSDYINVKRARRGLAPRPVRCCVIGFPNIGKSALINRLLGRKVVESAARPGVTRVLRCVPRSPGFWYCLSIVVQPAA